MGQCGAQEEKVATDVEAAAGGRRPFRSAARRRRSFKTVGQVALL